LTKAASSPESTVQINKSKTVDSTKTAGSSNCITKNRQGKMYQARYFKDHYFDAIEIIRPVAEKNNLTLLEVALRWVMNHSQLNLKERDGVIIGCSSIAQLESNLKDLEKGPLPADVLTALDVYPL
jgi:aflatoxin B1 aldehyde reductase